MWQVSAISVLVLTSVCLAAPQQTELPKPGDDGNLDALIGSVFNNNNPTTPVPSSGFNSGNLDELISNVFNDNPNINNNNNNNNQNVNSNNGVSGNGSNGNTVLGVNNQSGNKPDDCQCVPYYQCQDGKILDDGVGLIDIRLSGPCENYLHICCKAPNIVKPEEKITPAPLARNGCGQRHPNGVGFRITGDKDNEAQFGEFPWMVAILKEEIIDKQKGQLLKVYHCGGALIHPRAVLTAAHCAAGRQPSQLKIRAGEWDTQTSTEIFPHQDRDVSKIIIHEQFHAGSLRNDFAILILSSPVDLVENVDVVCLPEQDDIYDGSRCFASGWGKDIFGQAGHYQVILKRVELPIVPHATCQNTLRTTRLGEYFVLNESFICAGGEPGKDTCKGDGGSPLVCPLRNDPTKYVQAGIVAWGIGCGENRIPGVYANVAAVRRWIDENMAYNNLDTTVYTY